MPSIAVAFPSANTSGNLIIAFVRMSTTSQTVSISDTAGNGYTDAVSQGQTSDGHQIHIFYAANVAAGANTVTASFSATNNHPWLAIYEYSGVTALDRTAAAQGDASAFASSGATANTSSANELLFAGVGLPASYTGTASAGSGFTVQQQDTGTSRGANETGLVTATGSFTGTFNLSASTNWSAVIATFTISAPPPNPPAITTTSLPSGTQGTSYSAALTATGGTTPYTWSITSGSLPAGLALTAGTGAISGTPTSSGTSSFTVQVTDSRAQTASQALSITVNPSGGGGGGGIAQWGSGTGGAIYYVGGNVGVGTSSPQTVLDIGVGSLNNAQLRVTGTDTTGPLTTQITNGSGSGYFGVTAAGNTVLATATAGKVMTFYTGGGTVERMRIDASGNVGIGTAAPQYPLAVNGTIEAKEVIVNTGWSDYVFDPDYALTSLSEVANYITENHHLPGIPPASEVEAKGVSLGEMQSKLLAKIEELTLHMIELQNENTRLQKRIERLEEK